MKSVSKWDNDNNNNSNINNVIYIALISKPRSPLTEEGESAVRKRKFLGEAEDGKAISEIER